MIGELIDAAASQDRLDAEAERFDAACVEREAPAVLASLPAAIDAVEAGPGGRGDDGPPEEYADASWQAATNLDEAAARAGAARAAVTQGEAARPPATARRPQPQPEGPGSAGPGRCLSTASRTSPVSSTRPMTGGHRDRRCRGGPGPGSRRGRRRRNGPGSGRGGPARELTRLADARRDIAHPPDVAAAYGKARRANEIADGVLAGIGPPPSSAPLTSRLETSIRGAQATVTRASDYVASRRGGVGGEARTRVAEAARHLDAAVGSARRTRPRNPGGGDRGPPR
jgi:hypothetical protein